MFYIKKTKAFCPVETIILLNHIQICSLVRKTSTNMTLMCVCVVVGWGRPVARADRAVQPEVARLRGEAARVQGAAREARRRRGKDLKVLETASYFHSFIISFLLFCNIVKGDSLDAEWNSCRNVKS